MTDVGRGPASAGNAPGDRHAGWPALVLAAGYGSRLAPITDHLPKPLLPVGGRPLLDLILDRLWQAGAAALAVNSHHLGGTIAAHLQRRPDAGRVVHFPEAEILGTGGALDNAREFLGGGPRFLVHNGDVLCDVDLAALVAAHDRSGAAATMLLASHPAVDTITLGADGSVRHIGGTGESPAAVAGDRQLTYTGIGVFDRSLLADIGLGFSSLVAPLARLIAGRPGAVRGWAPQPLVWHDLGTLARWLDLAGEADPTPDGFRLARLSGHGSDRRFWRLGCGDWSAVAMITPPGDDEHERFLAVAEFLSAEDLGPARLLAVDEPGRAVLMEDLGRRSLHDLVSNQTTPPTDVATAYAAVVEHLLRLQAATDRAAEACPLAVDRCLDEAQLRWETGYFKERFLGGHLGRTDADLAGLAGEFAALAAVVAAQPLRLLHRDFQSQNILLQGDQVRLVDFQGLRLGPLGYDLASLLWDPYVDVPADLRQALLTRFARGCDHPDPLAVQDMVVAAGLQRIMQALGAYGFLGHVKGKPGFLSHIPAAVRRLDDLLALSASRRAAAGSAVREFLPPPLPRLAALVADLKPAESGA